MIIRLVNGLMFSMLGTVISVNLACAEQPFSLQETMFSDGFVSTSFFSLISNELAADEKGGGRLSSYNYFTLAYKYGGDRRVALRLPFMLNSAGFDEFNGNKRQDQEFEMQDVFVSLTDYNLALLPFDTGLFWEGRVYLPTSEHSKDSGLISRFRNDFIFTNYLTRNIVLEYVSKLNYYYQSVTAYKNEFIGGDGLPVTTKSLTKSMYHDHWLQAWYVLGPGFGVGGRLGWEDTYYNKSRVEDLEKDPRHNIKFGPSLRFELNSHANFIFNVSDIVDNSANRDELGQFKTENVELSLLAFIRI